MKPIAMISFATGILAIPASMASAQTTFDVGQMRVEATILAKGLDHPWGMDFLPDGSAVVTERSGALHILDPNGELTSVAGVPEVWSQGQGGLLDVKAAPDFADSRLLYLSFSQPGDGGAGTAVARGKLERDGATPRLANVEIIFSMEKKTPQGQHFGSRLVFGPDGNLFATTGDRGDSARAQDPADSAGAVLRMAPDGGVPEDNPYADGGGLGQVWSKGHRNVQGATFDPVTGALITVEHGAKGGDEINRPEAGKNYGWPLISYGVNYSGTRIGMGTRAEGMEQPLFYWDPSIAPSGLAAYEGAMFPEWRGDLLVGSLKFEMLSRLDRDETGNILGEERMFEGVFGRIRDVDVAPDGAIWLLTDERDGAIIRLSRVD